MREKVLEYEKIARISSEQEKGPPMPKELY